MKYIIFAVLACFLSLSCSSSSDDQTDTLPLPSQSLYDICYVANPTSYELTPITWTPQPNETYKGYNICGDVSVALIVQKNQRQAGELQASAMINSLQRESNFAPNENHNYNPNLSVEFAFFYQQISCSGRYLMKPFFYMGESGSFDISDLSFTNSSDAVHSTITAIYSDTPETFSCGNVFYYFNEFANSNYIIFRIKNLTTNRSKYGWARISAGCDYSMVTDPVVNEYAINQIEEVPIAPGYVN